MLALAGCTVAGPDYEPVEPELPAVFSEASPPSDASELSPAWWEVFDSPEISRLIGMAETRNHSLQAAWHRLRQAYSVVRREGALQRPGLTGQAAYSRFQDSEEASGGGFQALDDQRYAAGVVAGWELDLFGRVQRLVEAAEADAGAAEAAWHGIRLALQTTVARSWLELAGINEERARVDASIANRRASFETLRQRAEAGTIDRLELVRSEALVAQAESEAASLERRADALRFAIASATGATSAPRTLNASRLPLTFPAIPAGTPSTLLRRRPDIVEAERAVAAAAARVGVAEATRYPTVRLTGEVGLQSLSIQNFAQGSAVAWAFGPQISVPLFQGYSLEARERIAEAGLEAAAHNYRQAVIDAFLEVETALNADRHIEVQLAADLRAALAAGEARRIAQDQYDAGLLDQLELLDAERTALDAERRLVRSRQQRFLNTVDLVRALGGMWQPQAEELAEEARESATHRPFLKINTDGY